MATATEIVLLRLLDPDGRHPRFVSLSSATDSQRLHGAQPLEVDLPTPPHTVNDRSTPLVAR